MGGRAAYQFIRTEDLNCTLLMVRSGHALSGVGPPLCIAEAGAAQAQTSVQKACAAHSGRSDRVRAAAGKDLPELGGKAGGGKGGEGRRRGNEKE